MLQNCSRNRKSHLFRIIIDILQQVLEECRRVVGYVEQELGSKAPKTLALGMSSRRNLCVHPRVSEERDPKVVDAKCRNMTSSWVREQAKTDSHVELCDFFEVTVDQSF